MTTSENTSALLRFLTEDLTASVVPEEVWLRAEDLFLDWLGSALASRATRPIPTFAATAKQMGPGDGPAQILTDGSTSSPYWAAWVNAASSHVLEQDDLHNSSVMHPATVIFPAVLAAAQDTHAPGPTMLLGAIAGYEAGVRLAEALGRSHYRHFHTTATAGAPAAALAVAKVLGLDRAAASAALGSAGTQAAGLWAFLRSGGDAGHSKQLHCAHAAASGLLSAYLARDGVRGASDVVEGPMGMLTALAGPEPDADASRLADGLGSVSGSGEEEVEVGGRSSRRRWALLETSFKFHACCRHTHPAADALLRAIEEHRIEDPLRDIVKVVARVHQPAVDVLGPVDAGPPPGTVHAAKFSMKSTLALIALRGSAGLLDFENHALQDPDVLNFRERVSMVLDPEVDEAYPKRWLGRVEVYLASGETVKSVCDEPKGDPGNTLTRPELEDKFKRLVAYGGGTETQAQELITWCWSLRNEKDCTLPDAATGHIVG